MSPEPKVVPFISQTEAWPVFVFCHRMSELPSSLKSPVPASIQLGPGLGLTAPPANDVRPAHVPDRRLIIRVPPQDVGRTPGGVAAARWRRRWAGRGAG